MDLLEQERLNLLKSAGACVQESYRHMLAPTALAVHEVHRHVLSHIEAMIDEAVRRYMAGLTQEGLHRAR